MSEMAYVGIKSCGCMVAACVDKPEYKKDVAKFVKGLINNGCTIERIKIEDARKNLKMCKCETRQTELGFENQHQP